MLLYIGVTLVVFIHVGTCPFSKDLFIRMVKGTFIVFLPFCIKCILMLSKPLLLLGINEEIILSISSLYVGVMKNEFFYGLEFR